MEKFPIAFTTGLLLLLLLPFSMASFAAAAEVPERITVAQVKALLDQGEPVVFLDTRRGPDWEASGAMIPGAIRISDNADLHAVISKLPRNGKIVTYCS